MNAEKIIDRVFLVANGVGAPILMVWFAVAWTNGSKDTVNIGITALLFTIMFCTMSLHIAIDKLKK